MEEADYVNYQETLEQTSLQVAGGDIGNFAKAGLILISTVTTGGLSGESSEAAMVFSVIIFLIIWLVTIFLLRHLLATHFNFSSLTGCFNSMYPHLHLNRSLFRSCANRLSRHAFLCVAILYFRITYDYFV